MAVRKLYDFENDGGVKARLAARQGEIAIAVEVLNRMIRVAKPISVGIS